MASFKFFYEYPRMFSGQPTRFTCEMDTDSVHETVEMFACFLMGCGYHPVSVGDALRSHGEQLTEDFAPKASSAQDEV